MRGIAKVDAVVMLVIVQAIALCQVDVPASQNLNCAGGAQRGSVRGGQLKAGQARDSCILYGTFDRVLCSPRVPALICLLLSLQAGRFPRARAYP
jgi:hypothetical protein